MEIKKILTAVYDEDLEDGVFRIPEDISEVDSEALNCPGLRKLVIPNTLSDIPHNLATLDNLEEILVEDGNECCFSVDGVLFNKDKTALILFPKKHKATSYRIPDSVKIIAGHAFCCCQNLTEVILPNNVEIGWYAFWGCTSLVDENGLIVIQNRLLYADPNLSCVHIPDGTITIESTVFEECKNLKEIAIPDSVTTIKEWAFSRCKNLEKITLPDSVTTIERGAFFNCKNLKEITLPNNVTEINRRTFSNCENLERIYIPDSVTEFDELIFEDCDKLTIHCHKGSEAEKYAKENHFPVAYVEEGK